MITGAIVVSEEKEVWTVFPLGDNLYTDVPMDFETYADAWQYAIEMGFEQYIIEMS